MSSIWRHNMGAKDTAVASVPATRCRDFATVGGGEVRVVLNRIAEIARLSAATRSAAVADPASRPVLRSGIRSLSFHLRIFRGIPSMKIKLALSAVAVAVALAACAKQDEAASAADAAADSATEAAAAATDAAVSATEAAAAATTEAGAAAAADAAGAATDAAAAATDAAAAAADAATTEAAK
jgi:hypothetical protein